MKDVDEIGRGPHLIIPDVSKIEIWKDPSSWSGAIYRIRILDREGQTTYITASTSDENLPIEIEASLRVAGCPICDADGPEEADTSGPNATERQETGPKPR